MGLLFDSSYLLSYTNQRMLVFTAKDDHKKLLLTQFRACVYGLFMLFRISDDLTASIPYIRYHALSKRTLRLYCVRAISGYQRSNHFFVDTFYLRLFIFDFDTFIFDFFRNRRRTALQINAPPLLKGLSSKQSSLHMFPPK